MQKLTCVFFVFPPNHFFVVEIYKEKKRGDMY